MEKGYKPRMVFQGYKWNVWCILHDFTYLDQEGPRAILSEILLPMQIVSVSTKTINEVVQNNLLKNIIFSNFWQVDPFRIYTGKKVNMVLSALLHVLHWHAWGHVKLVWRWNIALKYFAKQIFVSARERKGRKGQQIISWDLFF